MEYNETFRQLSESAEEEIISGHLYAALSLIDHLLNAGGPPPERSTTLPELTVLTLSERIALREQANEISSDYQRMLYYMAEGMSDPSRNVLHLRLKQKAFRILQDLRRSYEKFTTQDIYATIIKELENEKLQRERENGMFSAIGGIQADNYEMQDKLFDLVWTAPQLRSNEEQQLRLFLITADSRLRCYMLSALTLALLQYFDAAKLRILCEYSSAESDSERARAVTGIYLATQLHANTISLYPTLREDLILTARREQFAEDVTKVQHYIILYQETDHLQQRMEKEIIPTLIKVTQQRKRMGFDEMEIDLTDPESTPNISRKARKILADSMLEMARLFQEGMDINLHTFTTLKRYAFFQRPGHWLIPFNEKRPEVPSVEALSHLPLCDNDKYSICLLLNHLPEAQRQQILQQLDSHSEVLAMHEEETHDEFQNTSQCLYRLLRRSPWVSQWPDVFSAEIQFIDNPIIGHELQKSSHFLKITASTLLRHKHYAAAQSHLEALARLQGSDAELLMQLALCAQEQGKFQQAISYCQQATMLSGPNQQALYRQQYCYARLERYDEQLRCLLQLEKMAPEDPQLLTETGLCLMQLHRWEEAQQRFYKMELMGKRLLPSLRAIAWCALRQGDHSQALKYYKRIVEGEMAPGTTWEDHLNLGHTLWLLGDVKSAIPHYRHYLRGYASARPESTDLLQPFDQDISILQEGGISASDICLMRDLIFKADSSEAGKHGQ